MKAFSKELIFAISTGGIITILLMIFAVYEIRQRELSSFKFESGQIKESVILHINDVEAASKSLRSLFHASDTVDADEFRVFSKEIFSSYPFIRSTQHAPKVAPDKIRQFEKYQETLGRTDFRIFEYDKQGVKTAVPHRELHFPLLYLEPNWPEELKNIGYDFMAVPTLNLDIFKAIESGLPIPSRPLWVKENKYFIYQMFTAVYREGIVPNTVEERMKKVSGFVSLTVNPPDLFSKVTLPQHIEVKLDILPNESDEEEIRLVQLKVDHSIHDERSQIFNFTGTHTIQISEQHFRLHLSKPIYLGDTSLKELYSAFATGVVFCFGLFLLAVGRARVRKEATGRQQTEVEMHHLRNLLSNIINSMPSVIIGVDLKERVIQWNSGAEELTRIAAKEALGQPITTLLPALTEELRIIQTTIKTSQRQVVNKVHTPFNEISRYSDITFYPLIDETIQGAVIRIDDVTERVRMDETLVQAEKMLSVGGLAAGMAHEINNPLAGILQNANVMSNRLTRTDIPANLKAAKAIGIEMDDIKTYMTKRDILRMISVINESGRRISDIVNNMLNFSRKSNNQRSTCDPSELIDKTLKLAATDYDLKTAYDFKSIKIQKNFQPDLPSIICESALIQQVLLNILRNGAEAMQEKVAINVDKEESYNPCFILRLWKESNTNMLCIEIEDNGPGMTKETCKRVFEPFYTTKPVGIGTGLGLSVSYFIITETHKGKIEVTSTAGQGSQFTIRLPLEQM